MSTHVSTEAQAAVVVPNMRLGKRPPKYDPRTLRLNTYTGPARSAGQRAPELHNLSRRTLKAFPELGMMGNDRYGNCTFAGLGHQWQTWSAYGGQPWRPSDEQLVEAYLRHTGGLDQGAYMLDVLNLARHDGLAGNRIYAYVAVEPRNHDQVRLGQLLFGGLYFGAGLPVSAQQQDVWELTTGNGSEPWTWGGHAMSVIDITRKGPVAVTWGRLQRITWAWWDRYVDECYAVLEEDYIGADRRSPQGFALSRLARDIGAL